MQNSKINTVLLVIVIILLVIGIWMFAKKNTPSGWDYQNPPVGSTQTTNSPIHQTNSSTNQQTGGTWVKTTNQNVGIVSFNSDWTLSSYMYSTPPQQMNGQADQVGYVFTLPSKSIIEWGGPQSSCVLSDLPAFQYGVSTQACIKGVRSDVRIDNVRTIVTQADKNAFGDFVQHN